MPNTTPPTPTRVWIATFPGASAMAVHGIAEILELANRMGGRRLFAVRRGPLSARTRAARHRFLARGEAWVAVPPGDHRAIPGITAPAFAGALAEHHRRGHRVAAACLGNFALGAAGLADGREVTTHWSVADAFQARFPAARLALSRILVDGGTVVSAGGYTAFLDLALWWVARAGGRGLALRVARVLQVDPGRESQLPWLGDRAPPVLADPALAAVLREVARAPAHPWTVPAMARAAGLGLRALERRFRAELGTTPRRWVQERRLERARRLLEGGATVQEACAGAGYEDLPSFVRLFRRRTRWTPGRYRAWARGQA
jgi:transcriptional regulator GlxA family with amidase domain